MRAEMHVCDRCDAEIPDLNRSMAVRIGRKTWELCKDCSRAARSYLSTDNTTSTGYPPPGTRELCTHTIPCGGSCGGPLVPIR